MVLAEFRPCVGYAVSNPPITFDPMNSKVVQLRCLHSAHFFAYADFVITAKADPCDTIKKADRKQTPSTAARFRILALIGRLFGKVLHCLSVNRGARQKLFYSELLKLDTVTLRSAGLFLALLNVPRAETLDLRTAGSAKCTTLSAEVAYFVFIPWTSTGAFFLMVLLRRHDVLCRRHRRSNDQRHGRYMFRIALPPF